MNIKKKFIFNCDRFVFNHSTWLLDKLFDEISDYGVAVKTNAISSCFRVMLEVELTGEE